MNIHDDFDSTKRIIVWKVKGASSWSNVLTGDMDLEFQ
jgi:hypothetical protein